MLTKYCIVVSDLDEMHFFLVGPFETKTQAKKFVLKISEYNVITSVHPYIKSVPWMGRMRETWPLTKNEVGRQLEALID